MNLVQVVYVNEYGEDVEIFFQIDPTLNGPLPITSFLDFPLTGQIELGPLSTTRKRTAFLFCLQDICRILTEGNYSSI